MLLKTHIRKEIGMHKIEQWLDAKLGKFSSSKIFLLCGEKGFGEGGLNYIRDKVGEELTGISADKEVDTESTRHGLLYELDGVKEFIRQKEIDPTHLPLQILVSNPDTRFASTPDGIWVKTERLDETSYDVEPIEVKCPTSYNKYIALFDCQGPLDLKRENRQYYFQCLDQIDNCGALAGWFIAYQPHFKAGKLKVIHFRIMEAHRTEKGAAYPLKNDLGMLRERKAMAVTEFNKIRDRLLGI